MEKRLDLKTGFLCNNNCLFCVQADSKQIGNRSFNELKKDLEEGMLKGCKGIVLTGGEPTIREDIIKLVSLCKKLGYKVIQIQSNGRRFCYVNFCKKMVKAGMSQGAFALHGHTKELHDSLTRAEGSFKQTIQGIRNLIGLNIPVLMNTVVVKQNYKYLPKIANLLVKLKVNQMQFAFVHPMGNAWKNFDVVVPLISKAAEYMKKAMQIGIKNGIRVMSEALPFCLSEGYEEYAAESIIPFTIVRGLKSQNTDNFLFDKVNKGKMKFSFCKECKWDECCEGPWREYSEKRGYAEFKPKK